MCNAGATGPDGGECTLCQAGEYKTSTGNGPCKDCTAGKYSGQVGSSIDSCQACESGKTSPTGSASEGACVATNDCPPGQTLTADSCQDCEAGTYKEASGSAMCTDCPLNSDAPAGASGCSCKSGFELLLDRQCSPEPLYLQSRIEEISGIVSALGETVTVSNQVQDRRLEDISETLSALSKNLTRVQTEFSSPLNSPNSGGIPPWNQAQYRYCQPAFDSWEDMRTRRRDGSLTVKAGGLGNLMVAGEYEAWVCVHDDACGLAGDYFFCYIFEETTSSFVPWDQHYNLRLFQPK